MIATDIPAEVRERYVIYMNNALKKRVNDNTVGIESLFNAPWTFFSISLRPLVLEEIPGNARTGCLIRTQASENDNASTKEEEINIRERIRMSWLVAGLGLSEPEKNKLRQDVEYLVSTRTDNILEIREVHKKLPASAGMFAGTDEANWLFTPDPIWESSLVKYAFLRRLAMPMHQVVVHDGATTALKTLDVSLLNLLLDLPDLTEFVAQLVNQRLHEIGEGFRDAEVNGSEPVSIRLRQLHGMLAAALERAGCSVRPFAPTKVQADRETCLVPEHIRESVRVAGEECERILRDLDERKKHPEADFYHYKLGGKIKLPSRIRNGTILLTEQDLTYEEFVRQHRIMKIVNGKLKRPFYPGISRPRMQMACLSDEAVSKLRSLFFDDDGHLRKSIISDIVKSPKHGYIEFANPKNQDVRNDYRWQVPIRRHNGHHSVATRSMVEAILSEQGILDPEHERIYDMGILIGGSENQSIHHDIPRLTTSWLPEDPVTTDKVQIASNPAGGWECDRAAYNEAMASPYAPCSVLIGMGESSKTKIGVQKNQTDRTGCPEGWCRIVNGKQSEVFRIVREDDHLVVVEATPGTMFTGDFQHAGVRSFPKNSLEDNIMKDFFDRVETIFESMDDGELDDTARVIEDVISMMCSFNNLHSICRFHCSTEPLRGPLRIPRNSIGFVDCYPNPPTDGVIDRD